MIRASRGRVASYIPRAYYVINALSGEGEESLPESRTDLTVLFTRLSEAYSKEEDLRSHVRLEEGSPS